MSAMMGFFSSSRSTCTWSPWLHNQYLNYYKYLKFSVMAVPFLITFTRYIGLWMAFNEMDYVLTSIVVLPHHVLN
jgi:hypothetical protein